MLVVPPNAAAIVPVSKSSEANVPPKGSSMCVCTSMPPGITYLPVALIFFAPAAFSVRPICATFSPSMSTSALYISDAVTIVPPVMSVVAIGSPSVRSAMLARQGRHLTPARALALRVIQHALTRFVANTLERMLGVDGAGRGLQSDGGVNEGPEQYHDDEGHRDHAEAEQARRACEGRRSNRQRPSQHRGLHRGRR